MYALFRILLLPLECEFCEGKNYCFFLPIAVYLAPKIHTL